MAEPFLSFFSVKKSGGKKKRQTYFTFEQTWEISASAVNFSDL